MEEDSKNWKRQTKRKNAILLIIVAGIALTFLLYQILLLIDMSKIG